MVSIKNGIQNICHLVVYELRDISYDLTSSLSILPGSVTSVLGVYTNFRNITFALNANASVP